MPPQPHVHNNGHPGLPHNPWVGIHGGGIPGDPWGSMHYGLHAQELKQEIKRGYQWQEGCRYGSYLQGTEFW